MKHFFLVERLEMQKRGLQDQISGLKKEVELLKEDLCKSRAEVAELEASRYKLHIKVVFKVSYSECAPMYKKCSQP